jgi:hypothetical protein
MCGNCENHEGGRLPKGTLEITILPDGRIKIETGNFAGPAHASAQAAIPALAQALGVTIKQARKLVKASITETAKAENKVVAK